MPKVWYLLSGNGQVVQSQFLSNLPLVVEAKTASGQPAAGVAINWKITVGAGTLVRPVNTTDANGQASVTFLATDVPGGESFFSFHSDGDGRLRNGKLRDYHYREPATEWRRAAGSAIGSAAPE